MPIAAPIIAAGVSALGSGLSGLFGAQAQKDAAKRQQQQAQQSLGQNYQQMGQNDRQFAQNSNLDRSKYLDQRAVGAADLQRRINLNPIADQAAYGIRNMLSAAPAPFQGRDFTRGTMPGSGQASGGAAPMLAAQNAAMQRYTPGAGGMDDSALIAARNRLQSMAGVPGEYAATDPNQLRLGAEMQQLQIDAANAKYAKDRINIQNRMNSLQGSLGGGGTAPNILNPDDVAQAERDAEKAAAKKRMMTMLGLGAAGLAIPGIGALAGGLAGGGAAPSLVTATPLLKKAASAAMTMGY